MMKRLPYPNALLLSMALYISMRETINIHGNEVDERCDVQFLSFMKLHALYGIFMIDNSHRYRLSYLLSLFI